MPAPSLLPALQRPPPPWFGEVAARLARAYLPRPPLPTRSREPLGGLIRTILSQQNTAPLTAQQFAGLKASYPRWEGALQDGPDGIEATLRAAGGGLARVKAGYIWGVLDRLQQERGTLSLRDIHALADAEVRGLLEGLPGVGQKTASCVMLFDMARPAMPVDTHIERIAKRLDLVPGGWNAVKVERWFDEVLPRTWEERYTFHVAAIRHGRQTCRSRRPLCAGCVLNDLCPSAGLFLDPAGEADPSTGAAGSR